MLDKSTMGLNSEFVCRHISTYNLTKLYLCAIFLLKDGDDMLIDNNNENSFLKTYKKQLLNLKSGKNIILTIIGFAVVITVFFVIAFF